MKKALPHDETLVASFPGHFNTALTSAVAASKDVSVKMLNQSAQQGTSDGDVQRDGTTADSTAIEAIGVALSRWVEALGGATCADEEKSGASHVSTDDAPPPMPFVSSAAPMLGCSVVESDLYDGIPTALRCRAHHHGAAVHRRSDHLDRLVAMSDGEFGIVMDALATAAEGSTQDKKRIRLRLTPAPTKGGASGRGSPLPGGSDNRIDAAGYLSTVQGAAERDAAVRVSLDLSDLNDSPDVVADVMCGFATVAAQENSPNGTMTLAEFRSAVEQRRAVGGRRDAPSNKTDLLRVGVLTAVTTTSPMTPLRTEGSGSANKKAGRKSTELIEAAAKTVARKPSVRNTALGDALVSEALTSASGGGSLSGSGVNIDESQAEETSAIPDVDPEVVEDINTELQFVTGGSILTVHEVPASECGPMVCLDGSAAPLVLQRAFHQGVVGWNTTVSVGKTDSDQW